MNGQTTANHKLQLPRIGTVKLHRFSLFSANPDAEFEAGDGVLCLIGANGIGKSTLLSAINFCLTGTVPDPTRTFTSIDEYYKYTRQFSRNYFRGRIVGYDEEDAEITVCFSLGSIKYEIKRGLFEPDELRGLKIHSSKATVADTLSAGPELPRSERHRRYTASLVRHTGLASFEEFVFLQHFVFTFDEQRSTLLWNSRIMERVLYRAFGLDPMMATRVDSIRREIQQSDSRVRNYQWQATRVRKRINEIETHKRQHATAREEYDTLFNEHETVTQEFDEQTKMLNSLQTDLKDTRLQLANLLARAALLRDEYSVIFRRQFGKQPTLTLHPLIVESIDTKTCGLCGTTGDKAINALLDRVHKDHCPLCATEVDTRDDASEHIIRLRQLDDQLSSVKRQIVSVRKGLGTLVETEAAAREAWATTRTQLDAFDRANRATLNRLRLALDSPEANLSVVSHREHLADLEQEKKEAYDERERFKRQLAEFQRTLEENYIQVERIFVPRFLRLATQFLGMPLAVQLEAAGANEVSLVVSVRGTTRRRSENLSESQRFFLDIALRMALIQHMSDPASLGAIFIDTPEGSLDISYEKRAGDMLADFAQSGHQIVMTANINSSKLLLELAHDCGRSLMHLCRMTDWAELSEVQRTEEHLFVEAYTQIEAAFGVTD